MCDTYSNFYLKDTYTVDIPMVVSSFIREYDVSAANLSILKRLDLMPDSEIEYLRQGNKEKRKKMVGLFQLNNPTIKKLFNDEFAVIRKEFFEANNIQNEDVFSIKKDAIFLINKPATVVDFKNVHYSLKNIYTSYIRLDNNEFYFKKSQIDIKGIKDTLVELHRNYMLEMLNNIFIYMERGTSKQIFNYLYNFRMQYINMELSLGYYRELNRQSLYRLKGFKMMKDDVGLSNINNDILNHIDISYNHNHYIIPLIRLLI